MWKLLILVGVAAAAFFAWKKFMASDEEEDFEDEMFESAELHEAEQPTVGTAV